VLFLKLAILPCCLDSQEKTVVQNTESCCATTAGDNHNDEQQEDKSCSPFLGCCASAGFIVSSYTAGLTMPLFGFQNPSFHYLNQYSFLQEKFIFQPPKVA